MQKPNLESKVESLNNFNITFTPKLKRNPNIEHQPNNPLHGIKLAQILDFLVDFYGFEALGEIIDINCFQNNPSIKSSLKFLRTTPWARQKVEDLYLRTQNKLSKN